jgi:transcriptional regulator with XRE-family HTH domain
MSRVDAGLERAQKLKAALTDFVYDAEGEIAIALESFVAEQLSRSQSKDAKQRDLAVDTFLSQGKVGTHSPLELFVEAEQELSERDRQLVLSWKQSFTGLFAVQDVLPDGFKLMNWLTAKTYVVKPTDTATLEAMRRFKPGEILLTRIAPSEDQTWMFFSPATQLGSLGKPKLAVAIGNFKQNHKADLYGDAPELLEEAWKSVERYHQDFLDFFGAEQITMSGYELGKKIAGFQDFLTQRRLDESGIDQNKSVAELAKEAGVSDEEITEMAEAMGMDAETAAKMLNNKAAAKMMTPQVELAPEIKKAEQVTILAHPRWGQMVLPTYTQFINLLQAEDWQSVKGSDKLIRKYLDDAEINAYVWHSIAEQYPEVLEKVLKAFLHRPDFDLSKDLDALLQEHHKPLEPELPEIASVPIHLNDLFQQALAEVSKTKSKEKSKSSAKGFQRS